MKTLLLRGWTGRIALPALALGLAACGGQTAGSVPGSAAAVAPPASSPPASAAVSAAAKPAAPASSAAASKPAASPSAAAKERIKAAYVSISAAQGATFLANDGGYFAAQGLDTDLAYIQGGATATAALLSASADLVEMSGPTVLAAAEKGGDLAIVGGTISTPVYSLVVDPSIKSLDDLRGKTVAVSKVGDLDDSVFRRLLKRYNMEAGRDIQIAQLQDSAGRVAALGSKAVQGALLALPYDRQAVAKGATVLFTPRQIDVHYPVNVLATRGDFLKSRRPAVVAYVKAMAQGIHRFKTDEAFTESVIARYLKTEDRELLQANWQTFGPLLSDVPAADLPAMQAVLDEMNVTDHKAADFVDQTIVKELQDSGFFASLT
jgi:NitT/TauT family transport system substrate-binding protein